MTGTSDTGLTVDGEVASGFDRVREVFVQHVADAANGGFAYAAYSDGRKVVDLWAGSAGDGVWRYDTTPLWMSVTKAFTALCVQILWDRGKLDVDAPIVDYWPEFAGSGKAGITIADVMTHRSGVVGAQELTDLISLDDAAGIDRTELIVEILGRAAPVWEPRTRTGYHTLTYGWILGEIVRRIDGRELGQFFRDEVALPLAVPDVRIGTPVEHHDKIPPIHPMTWPDGMPQSMRADIESMLAQARDASTPAGISCIARDGVGALDRISEIFNSSPGRVAPLGGSNLAGSARSVAKVFASLASSTGVDGVALVSPEALEAFTVVRNTDEDLVMRVPIARALGYWRNISLSGRPQIFGPHEEAFGHTGVGGQLGFADPKGRVGAAFVRSHHTAFGVLPILLNAALYESLADAV